MGPVFLALADVDGADAVSSKRADWAVLRYPSGRPCLLIEPDASHSPAWSCPAGTVVALQANDEALFRLGAAIVDVESRRQLEALLAQLSPPFTVALIDDDGCSIYCDPLLLANLHWSLDHGGMASNDLTEILDRAGRRLNLDGLMVRLMGLGGPWPLCRIPLWQGIETLEVGHCLDLGGSQPRLRQWWSIDQQATPVDDLPGRLGEALICATGSMLAGDGPLGADYSGGLDSTAAAYLAHLTGRQIHGYHVRPADPTNDDTEWAQMALTETNAIAHVVASRGDSSYFASTAAESPEGPFPWSAGRQHLQATCASDTILGISEHLTGFGGDELFTPMPAQLWSLWQQTGIKSVTTIRRYAQLNRIPLREAMVGVRSRATFGDELARAGRDQLTSDPETDLSWGIRVELPAWISADGRESMAAVCDDLAISAQPLSQDRARHQAMVSLAYEANLLRRITADMGQGQVQWLSPFLDPTVISLALSQDSAARIEAGRLKLLLRDALKLVMPARYFERNVKGEYSRELFEAIKLRGGELSGFFGDSQLAELGLIDLPRLHKVLDSGLCTADEIAALELTFEAEHWLRQAS